MPYTIAAVIAVIGVVAFTVMQSDPAVESEVILVTEEVRTPEEESPIVPEAETAVSTEPETVADAERDDGDATEFADGSYTAQTSYFTPRRTEHTMDVTLVLEDNIVTEASILWDGEVTPKTPNHSGFDEAYKEVVLGLSLDEIQLSRVGGASLTSESFNEAVKAIETQAGTS